MKVKIIRGPHTDENIQKCYHVLVKHLRKELLNDSDLWESIHRGPIDQRIRPKEPDRRMQEEN